jgi:hypothetical protein
MASTWKNGTNPSGVVTSPRELGTLGRERLKMAFQSEHQGTGNHGRVVVLEDETDFKPIEANAVDMAYLGARDLNRQEVCTVMDLPPSSLQDMTHATFSNIEENGRSLYRDSLSSRITFIEDVVDWDVGREFNGPKQMKFAVAEQLRGSFTERAESVAKLVQCGVMKPAEARQFFDLNVAGPEADELYIQGAMVPLGQAPANAAGAGGVDGSEGITHVPAITGSGGTDVPAIQKHVRHMSGLLGRGRTLQEAAREVIQKTGDQDGVRDACEFLLERRIA